MSVLLDNERFPKLNRVIKKLNENWLRDTPYLHHVTRKSNLPSIIKNGLKTSYFGTIHGEMDQRPKDEGVYLSRHEESNNLNSALFDNGGKLVIIKIKNKGFDESKIFPDDGLFAGFADEHVFNTKSDIVKELRVTRDEAEDLLELFENAKSDDIAELMKPLWSWYLKEHGEISIAHDINPENIVSAFDYESKEMFDIEFYKNNKSDIDMRTLRGLRDFLIPRWGSKHKTLSELTGKTFKTEDESLCRYTAAFLSEALNELSNDKWFVEGGEGHNKWLPKGGYKDSKGDWSGHYWVTNGKVIIDLAAKQFGDKNIVVVPIDSQKYHENYTKNELYHHLSSVSETVEEWMEDFYSEFEMKNETYHAEMAI